MWEREQVWRRPGDLMEQRSGQPMGVNPLDEPRKLVTKAKKLLEDWLHRFDCQNPDAALLKETKLSKMNRNLAAVPLFLDQAFTRFEGEIVTEFKGPQKRKNPLALPNKSDKPSSAVTTPFGGTAPATSLWGTLVASAIYKIGAQCLLRGNELGSLDAASASKCVVPKKFFQDDKAMVVYAIPIPTTKTNKTDTMHYATLGHTEDWMEDALFEIGILRMYAAEVLGHAKIGNLTGTMSPLIPGAMVKSTMTFNRISYESMHSTLLSFLRWCRDTSGYEQLQDVITHLVSCQLFITFETGKLELWF